VGRRLPIKDDKSTAAAPLQRDVRQMEETTALVICQLYRVVNQCPIEFIHAFSLAQLIFRAVINQSVLRG